MWDWFYISVYAWFNLMVKCFIIAALLAVWGISLLNHLVKPVHLFDERTSHIFRKVLMSSQVMADTAFFISHVRQRSEWLFHCIVVKINHRLHAADCFIFRCMQCVRDTDINAYHIWSLWLFHFWLITPSDLQDSVFINWHHDRTGHFMWFDFIGRMSACVNRYYDSFCVFM